MTHNLNFIRAVMVTRMSGLPVMEVRTMIATSGCFVIPSLPTNNYVIYGRPLTRYFLNFIRAVMVWATSMSGLPVTEVRTMIATAMAMRPPCGPFPSTLPSTRGKMHTMTKAVHPLWHQHSLMAPKIPTLEW